MKTECVMRPTGPATAEILMYGDLGDLFGGMTAQDFDARVKSLGKVSEINLRINSEGGEVFMAVAAYNILTRHPARVVVDVDGLALSAASLVAMAGDKIRMAENAMMMIHEPWARQAGTAAELREHADRLDRIKATVRTMYAKRTGQTEDEIDVMMAAETWMSADEAVEKGFANEVTSTLKVAAYVERDRYRKVPQRLVRPTTTYLDAYTKRLEALKR